MGEAKRRRTEIEKLRQNSPEEVAARRQAQEDDRLLSKGIDPEAPSFPEEIAAMARLLATKFKEAKQSGIIDEPVKSLYAKINATTRGLADVPIACRKGCSHCCHAWVSVSAPEALFVGKLVRQRGPTVTEKIMSAHRNTQLYDFETRNQHPCACPLLEDGACSIYADRPKACRLAASRDSEVCRRSYLDVTNEDIPMPYVYQSARSFYSAALCAALKKNNLPYRAYEFNAALSRVLETEDAERRWLSGEDIFANTMCDPMDIMSQGPAQMIYGSAFP